MKWSVAAVVMILLISTLPLVQSQATEEQIQGQIEGQIQEPREQSPAGGFGQVLTVVGANLLAIANAIYTAISIVYTTCFGVLNAAYTTLCGGCAGILAACVNFIYTSVCGTLWNLFNSLCGAIFGMGVMDILWGIVNSCWSLGNSLCGFSWDVIDAGLSIVVGVIGAIVAFVDTIWDLAFTTCAGLDILNLPFTEALANLCFGLFWGLEFFFTLCTMSGIPCCGWCIGPIGLCCVSFAGIIGIGGYSDLVYYCESFCSTLPFF